jgi:hypothetical protein
LSGRGIFGKLAQDGPRDITAGDHTNKYCAKKMRRFLQTRFFKVLVVPCILGIVVVGGLDEPRSSIGHIVFHSAYLFPPARPAFLRFFNWSLTKMNGVYLPPSIDEFLIDRLAYCKGSPEESAIIDFQIRQASGRWGDSASRSHESFQHQMIANIMGRLNDMEDPDAVSAMGFIESLRRRDSLGKGGFTGMWTDSGNSLTLNRSAFEAVKRSRGIRISANVAAAG